MPDSKPLARIEAFVAAATVIAAVFGTCWSTRGQLKAARAQIAATREDLRRENSAEALIGLKTAANGVVHVLQDHGSMYIEIHDCLARRRAPEDCWTRDYAFDLERSAAAWNAFDIQLDNGSIFLDSREEQKTLQQLRDLKTRHFREFPTIRAPRTLAEAEKAVQYMTNTEKAIQAAVDELSRIVTRRARTHDSKGE